MANDLISRQAAIDALVRKIRPHNNGDGTMTIYVMSEGLVRETLNALPSADIPTKCIAKFTLSEEQLQECVDRTIVRCKDCKYYQFADNRAFGMPVKMCKWFRFEDVDDDDFCSRAERRTDEPANI